MYKIFRRSGPEPWRCQSTTELRTLKFLSEGANALIVGKSGTGKSHIAKVVAYQATLLGHDVAYVEADSEFARYALADADERARMLKGWVAADLLVLDDLFLARRISEHGAELLRILVHQRYKLRRSLWPIPGDATMATLILDRLMHRCAMLEFEGKSYRLKGPSPVWPSPLTTHNHPVLP